MVWMYGERAICLPTEGLTRLMTALASPARSLWTSIADFWHRYVYRNTFAIVASVCGLFAVLTTLAMFLYPGGTVPVASTHGYLFFVNFFSDLGQTRTQSGAYNYPSMVLFIIAMTAVAIGLGAFFVTFARFFASRSTSVWAQRANLLATLLGVGAAICFIGVAATPHNLFLAQHNAFVQWAFRLLLAAVMLEIVAIRLTPGIPVSLLRVNLAFVIILFGYLLLLFFGPSTANVVGAEINVVGQKLIVYTSVGTIFMQSFLIRLHIAQPLPATAEARRRDALAR